jgi:hypothetical protein
VNLFYLVFAKSCLPFREQFVLYYICQGLSPFIPENGLRLFRGCCFVPFSRRKFQSEDGKSDDESLTTLLNPRVKKSEYKSLTTPLNLRVKKSKDESLTTLLNPNMEKYEDENLTTLMNLRVKKSEDERI